MCSILNVFNVEVQNVKAALLQGVQRVNLMVRRWLYWCRAAIGAAIRCTEAYSHVLFCAQS